MKTVVRNLFRQHTSLLILLFGGGGLYVSNVILSFYLSPEDYAKFGLLSAYIAVVTVFSGFGFDQVILRYVKVSGNSVELPAESVIPSILLVIVSSLIFAFLFGSFFWERNIFLLFICSLCSGVTIYYYTLFRVMSHFSAAQIQKNLWKILFPILMGGGLFFDELDADFILDAVVVLLIFSSFLGWFQAREISVGFRKHGWFDWRLLWGYFSAMIIMNFMTAGDRFFIDSLLGAEALARYFFLQNIFLYPLSQLQNYFGFKDVVAFKNHLSVKVLNKMLYLSLIHI